MKLNLDCEPKDMGPAMNTAFKLIAENPDQEIGSKGALFIEINLTPFEFTRNEESYTMRAV